MTSIFLIGKWPLSEVGLLLGNSCMQSWLSNPLWPKPLPMAWNAVLCLQCPGLPLGLGHQLGLLHWPWPWLVSLCLYAIRHQQQLPPESCWGPWCSRFPTAARWWGDPRAPEEHVSQGGHERPVGWPPPLAQSPSIYLFLSRTQQAASQSYSSWGHQAGQGKGNNSAPGETLQGRGGQGKGDLCSGEGGEGKGPP